MDFSFKACLQKLLLLTLDTPSVIFMNNVSFHRMSKIESLYEEQGYQLLSLPLCQPESNFIEKN